MQHFYFDHNATTPVSPEVFQAMAPMMTEVFGNASSIHHPGQIAKQRLEMSRRQVAAFMNCDPREIVFLSGGTEAVDCHSYCSCSCSCKYSRCCGSCSSKFVDCSSRCRIFHFECSSRCGCSGTAYISIEQRTGGLTHEYAVNSFYTVTINFKS